MIKLNFKVAKNEEIKDFLQAKHFSNKFIAYYLHNQDLIRVNNHPLNSYYLKENDEVEITLSDETSSINIIEGKLNIVYEDEYLLIVNKPHNLAVSGTSYHYNYHLSGMIYKYFLENGIKSTVHFVNRLDYETSGLVLIAKHSYIHHLFNYVKINKKYYCLTQGRFENLEGMIDKPIIKEENDARKRKIDPLGKPSKTLYRLIHNYQDFSLLDITLLTGRTHQIRLHMSSINHPLVGDKLYGSTIENNILLQSYHLDFIHPILNKEININLDLDLDIVNFLKNKF